jgi:hypothetical protein
MNADQNSSASIRIPKAIRDSLAWDVGKIPTAFVQGRSHGAAAGHLQETVGIRLPYPIQGVAQPIGTVLLALIRELVDFIVAPNPDAPLFALPGCLRTPQLSISTK